MAKKNPTVSHVATEPKNPSGGAGLQATVKASHAGHKITRVGSYTNPLSQVVEVLYCATDDQLLVDAI